MNTKNTDNGKCYRLTESGILHYLFGAYGINADLPQKVAEHFIQDLLEILCKQGIVERRER